MSSRRHVSDPADLLTILPYKLGGFRFNRESATDQVLGRISTNTNITLRWRICFEISRFFYDFLLKFPGNARNPGQLTPIIHRTLQNDGTWSFVQSEPGLLPGKELDEIDPTFEVFTSVAVAHDSIRIFAGDIDAAEGAGWTAALGMREGGSARVIADVREGRGTRRVVSERL